MQRPDLRPVGNLLGVIFIVLLLGKLLGFFTISWFWVFSPFYTSLILFVLSGLSFLLAYLVKLGLE